MTRHHRHTALAVLATVSLTTLSLGGCAGGRYADTPLPTPPSSSATSSSATPSTCDPATATQTYQPLTSIPASASITDAGMRTILDRGRLIVGVSADTYLLGARDPLTNTLEGFDIDVAKAVAKRLFGDDTKITWRVISAADRIPLLQKGAVDLVARNMTMTCDRWQQIAFSSEYYHAGQKVLVARGSTAKTLEDLKGQRVCAPTKTTSLAKLQSISGVTVVTAENHTGCLVKFQQGQADAITGDDTVLAGLAAQDPYAVVTDAPAITDEPYGLGVNGDNVYFVRYVNAVLAQVESDGEWKQIYNRWLAPRLGKAPNPPVANYGRG
ncbi:MAG: glutamate ABC transporter substrate-binding protein [Tetrasphaera sp.]|nr:glutamate ABC transporter substrate-binding protein [Tetrasphaera sp.]